MGLFAAFLWVNTARIFYLNLGTFCSRLLEMTKLDIIVIFHKHSVKFKTQMHINVKFQHTLLIHKCKMQKCKVYCEKCCLSSLIPWTSPRSETKSLFTLVHGLQKHTVPTFILAIWSLPFQHRSCTKLCLLFVGFSIYCLHSFLLHHQY